MKQERGRRLLIRGKPWRIINGRPPRNNCSALCDYDTRTIWIRKGSEKAPCIVHEVVHALFPDLKEEVVEEAEAAIITALELSL